jgi:riboflavin biosynthesis pyrimidine reductase
MNEANRAEAYAYPDISPWLRANMVSSIDGAATREGKAGGLGNAEDQRIMSLLRALADVVIVGANTVRVEGYGSLGPLDCGHELREGRPALPTLAIVSGALDLDFDSATFTDPEAQTIVITCESAPEDRRRAAARVADVILAGRDRVDVSVALDALAERGYVRQLTEGGPGLLAQFVAARRLDELCMTLSPHVVAGDAMRIINGPLHDEPTAFQLGHVIEQDDFLFLRYRRA